MKVLEVNSGNAIEHTQTIHACTLEGFYSQEQSMNLLIWDDAFQFNLTKIQIQIVAPSYFM